MVPAPMPGRRVTDTFISAADAVDLLGVGSSNLHALLKRPLRAEERVVRVLTSDRGVEAQEVIVGRRPMWVYRRDYVQKLHQARERDVAARARDAQRRSTLRARSKGG